MNKRALMDKKAKLKRDKVTPWLRFLYTARGRCKNKNYTYFKKGIKCYLSTHDIKELWVRDRAYLMSEPSIDRIDVNGNYIFENCRFIELIDNIRLPRTKCRTSNNKYKGVYWINDRKKYRVIVTKDGKNIHCGEFRNEKEAAIIYNHMVSKIFNMSININKV